MTKEFRKYFYDTNYVHKLKTKLHRKDKIDPIQDQWRLTRKRRIRIQLGLRKSDPYEYDREI